MVEFKGAIVRALTPDIPWDGQSSFWKAVNRLSGSGDGEVKAELPRDTWPMMVRFRNINDPKSVERVKPEAIGVKRILLETTSDDVTTGIEKRLGWLGDRGNVVSGSTINPALTETIYHEAFWQGYKK